MRAQVAAFTPLRVPWPHGAQLIAPNVEVVAKPDFDETDWAFWNLRPREQKEVPNREHWLTAVAGYDPRDPEGTLDKLAHRVRWATVGLQLWCPIGWDGITLLCESTQDGRHRVERVFFDEPYGGTNWSRIVNHRNLDPAELRILVEGTVSALESGKPRVVNPFQFLEIGLQTAANHPRAAALLWIAGLDGLLAAESRDLFGARLTRLLGEDAFVLPEDLAGRRPKLRVSDVAGKIFEWRGLIAHGKALLEKYTRPIPFDLGGPHELSHLPLAQWTEDLLVVESSLFVLIAAFKKVIAEGKLGVMADVRRWKGWLDERPA